MTSHSFVFIVSGIVGFGPAVAVLFHALRTYDYPYTERAFFDSARIFFALAVGIVLGTVSGWISVAFSAGILTLASLVIALLLLALFEESFKLVYLNRKGYRGRFDTTFCGVSLGIGIAALVAAGNAYVNGPALLTPGFATQLGVFSASLALLHASTGAIIGFGCSRKETLRPFAQAYVARTIHAAMLVPFFVWSALPPPQPNPAIPLFSLVAAAAFALALYLLVYRSVLPDTLPAELRRERRRGLRKRRAPSGKGGEEDEEGGVRPAT